MTAAFPGQTTTFNITYQNLGMTTLTGVVVTESYDPNVQFISANPSPDLGTDNVWTIGTLGPGASGTIEVVVQASWDLPGGAILRNEVQITSYQGAEDNDQEKTTVLAPPVLEAEKTASLYTDANHDGVVSPGDTLLYIVTITNSGDAEATGVVFTDTSDTNTKLVVGSVYTSQGIVTAGNDGVPPVTVDVGNISINGTVEIRFQVTIDRTLHVTQVANQGVVTSNELRDVPTDDPSTPQGGDPTVTPVHLHRPAAVPSVSIWGMVVMAALFAGLLVWLMRRRATADTRK